MHQAATQRPLPGEVDVWAYDLLELGGRLECTNARTFLYYAASTQTYGIWVEDYHTQRQQVNLRVYGPVADTGGRLYVHYHLTKSELATLAPEEIELMRKVLKDKIKKRDDQFPKESRCIARVALSTLSLPYIK